MHLVCYNEGEQRDRFSCARRHFQDSFASDIESLLQSSHVIVLLWVYARVRKYDFQFSIDRCEPYPIDAKGDLLDEEPHLVFEYVMFTRYVAPRRELEVPCSMPGMDKLKSRTGKAVIIRGCRGQTAGVSLTRQATGTRMDASCPRASETEWPCHGVSIAELALKTPQNEEN